MKNLLFIFCTLLIFLNSCNSDKSPNGNAMPVKPNIIYILADDLGFGELGCYGQNLIETPNIDKLAQNGIKFLQHYSGSAVCAPSRCMLLTGKHPGHAHIRGNDAWNERGDVWNYRAQIADSLLEGQRPLPDTTVTLAQKLKQAGYATGIVGKWGLGAPNTTSTPLQKGFDFFVGYNCQRQAHTYYPVHLYKNDVRIYLGNDTVAPGTSFDKGADPYDINSYKKYNLEAYSETVMFNEMTEFINENDPNKTGRPFFMYWATPIPHTPLQAPQKWVDYYVKKFGNEEPYLGDGGNFPHRYPHAAYAGMVSYLDENVGLLVEQLKKMGIYDNTLIIFTSDNGPSGGGGTDRHFFNSGGPLNTKGGRTKGSLYEAGIRVPMIASWPAQIKANRQTNHISAFWDVMPTLCEIADIAPPEGGDGISFLPVLYGKKNQASHDHLYWEFPASGGLQAVRKGPWKGIRRKIHKGNMEIELFNLDKDIKELNNVAHDHPQIVKEIELIMKQEHQPATIKTFQIKNLNR